MKVLTVDLGATSGRTALVSFENGRIVSTEFTRFENPQLPLTGHIYWDLPHLYNEILRALRKVAAEGLKIESIGIDTWGCDVSLFGADGQLLGLPHCYRDAYTDAAMPAYFEQVMPKKELYARTGIQFMPFNTLFQLYAQRREGSVALQQAAKILFTPDALIYMLTGEAVCEYTIASTSQILNPETRDLDTELLASLNLKREQFGRLVQPGTRIGVLSAEVQQATGVGAIPVVAVAAHDTASAVAAVPAPDANYAYLSCGTWSLLGIESPRPIINDDSFKEDFTNEGGVDGTTRFLKNICGLWIFEQSRKDFKDVPTEIGPLSALSMESSCESLINPDDPLFAHPASMTEAIRTYLQRSQQALPETPADYIRVIYRSLAARYKEIIEVLRRLSDVDIQRLHVIGGGSRNPYLMQFTADALQIPVVAGPTEGTVAGNALMQLRAAGLVSTLSEMRAIMRNSVETRTYYPTNAQL